ncbi:hypothetical protein QPX50_09320 [Corynebacterium accolens]|uniref:hypothetical protein n=1 Tax=Corynebacterium accolens TaxID=38284 RepID=UPI00019C410C|nr:hypothetical protein [Corynebacterium accolens]EEI15285.1 hypothetical protein HMPREF0276_0541 [Corynebacterium accolens ATCC 49725]ERS51308.1 hypothetical protein HMPREF1267_02429 [Corynebacterium sp. KPL1824]MDK4331101.1 hypothetical protein [Corynebacterium accolens]UQZ28843.1 hypothetical protein CACC_10870 [Corynebacterium accolens]
MSLKPRLQLLSYTDQSSIANPPTCPLSGGQARWFSPWPDIVVGLVVAVINLGAAKEVLEAAQAEDPELELDE